MAQWDVYANPNPRAREAVPFVVVLQSDLLDGLPMRFAAPLVRKRGEPESIPRRMTPMFMVQGIECMLRPHQAGPVDSRLLKHPVGSLRSHAHRLTDALDAVLSGV